MPELQLLKALKSSPEAVLELMLLAEYLKEKGYSPETINALPSEQVKKLLSEASTHVSCQLAEINTRTKFFRSGDQP